MITCVVQPPGSYCTEVKQLTNKSETKSTKCVKLTLQAPACTQSHHKTCNKFWQRKTSLQAGHPMCNSARKDCNTIEKDYTHLQRDKAADPTPL